MPELVVLSVAEEVKLWMWWNWYKHNGKNPGKNVVKKAKQIAKQHSLSDEYLEEVWERWSTAYLTPKTEGCE